MPWCSNTNPFLSKGLACSKGCYKPTLCPAPNALQQCLKTAQSVCKWEVSAYPGLLHWKLFQVLDGLGSFQSFRKTQLKALGSQQLLVLVFKTRSRFCFSVDYSSNLTSNILHKTGCLLTFAAGSAINTHHLYTSLFFPLWDWNYKSSSCICSTTLCLAEKFSEPTPRFSVNNFQ